MRKSALAALAALAIAGTARAQELFAPQAKDVAVAYPEGAHGDAVVVLELVIAPDGTVASWRVLAGAEPFLSAVKAAVATFRFDPARRDDRAIRARIRVEIPFHENALPAAAVVLHVERVVRRVLPAPKPMAGVEDVHVRGVRKEIGGTTMSKEDVRQVPGAFGDAFRAIDMMPGVTPIISGLPFFFIRGAPPGNTGYFVDGVRVPLLYHLAVGPSVIHPSLIDRVDFYPGGYPAPYGRYTGGIVAGETRGPASRIGGEAEVRLFDAGVLGEAPFAGGKGDALVAGRYGYPGLLLPLFAPGTMLSYWDYQGRVSYRVAPRDTLTAFVFGSFDELDQAPTIGEDQNGHTLYGPYRTLFRTEFHRAYLRWDHAVPGGRLRTAITFGIDDSGADSGGDDSEDVRAESIQLRTELDRRVAKGLRLRAGADALLYHYEYTQTQNIQATPISVTLPARNDVIFGGYGDVVWQVHPRVEIVPGLRLDVFTSRAAGSVDPSSPLALVTGDKATAVVALDPRAAARVRVSDRLTWVGTLGLMHQPPSFAAPVPGGELGTLSGGIQSAVQASQGFEAQLPWAIELKGTLFLQRYFGMTNAFASCSSIFNEGPDVSCLDARVNGRSAGFEVLLKRSFSKRIGGWISYTFSRAVVEIPHPAPGEASEVPSNFDRTHVLNAAFAYDFGKGYHAGARFTYYTGLPYTETGQDSVPVPPYNGHRLPDFWRIDLRLEKRWRLGKRGEVAVVLEGQNITFNKEAITSQCVYDQRKGISKCSPQYVGPVSVPSLGLEAKY